MHCGSPTHTGPSPHRNGVARGVPCSWGSLTMRAPASGSWVLFWTRDFSILTAEGPACPLWPAGGATARLCPLTCPLLPPKYQEGAPGLRPVLVLGGSLCKHVSSAPAPAGTFAGYTCHLWVTVSAPTPLPREEGHSEPFSGQGGLRGRTSRQTSASVLPGHARTAVTAGVLEGARPTVLEQKGKAQGCARGLGRAPRAEQGG